MMLLHVSPFVETIETKRRAFSRHSSRRRYVVGAARGGSTRM